MTATILFTIHTNRYTRSWPSFKRFSRSQTVAVLPNMLADSNAGATVGSVGGQSGGLHTAKLPAIPVPSVGAGARLDYCVTLAALHTSIRYCRNRKVTWWFFGRGTFLFCCIFPMLLLWYIERYQYLWLAIVMYSTFILLSFFTKTSFCDSCSTLGC